MRKLLLVGLFLAGACTTRTVSVPESSPTQGPRPALAEFLASVRSQDLQAMAGAWGDRDGAVRDNKKMSREEMEQRELLLMCYFKHDSYRVLGDSPGTNGERILSVELTKGTLKRTTNFYLVQGRDRWYVRSADIEPVKDFCNPDRKK
ncbi:MAG: hypothetical protein HOQ17_17255 [Gemmatimonadaceae bacterium]|nr:hypothetical protein [Gemmatimonadaceae bacterium]NUO93826.1 hypothetical protein [Gemmatimonadaceae bacterium]NUP71214.1 hypothetical protein [Gemmatimonadaceae bacterium]NUR32530.1 hypothetical protein [Gemmatimonadaceae bacterium]NUS34793.1 hypothetical protein [Gemmatimonadaceae bacterium]